MMSVAILMSACQVCFSDALVDRLARTVSAVAMVESGGDPQAYNPDEDAVGILQVRPIMVEDVNRILGGHRYSLDDRANVRASCGMFVAYCLHYWPDGTPEQWARGWNGGPKGPQKDATQGYWGRVKAEIVRQSEPREAE